MTEWWREPQRIVQTNLRLTGSGWRRTAPSYDVSRNGNTRPASERASRNRSDVAKRPARGLPCLLAAPNSGPTSTSRRLPERLQYYQGLARDARQ